MRLRRTRGGSESRGQIHAEIDLTSDPMSQAHRFMAGLDQSHLPVIIRGIEHVMGIYPIRGKP